MAFTLNITGKVIRNPGGNPVPGLTVRLKQEVGGDADVDVTDSLGDYAVSHTEATETFEDHWVEVDALPPHYSSVTGPTVPHEHTAYEHNLAVPYVNNNPTKDTVGAQTWTRDTGVQTKDFAIADADAGDILTVVKTSGPSWMTVSTPSNVLGRISFDTTGVAPSFYSGGVRVLDDYGGGSSTENFNITILAGNTPPALNNPGTKNYPNNSGNYTFQLVANDGDSDPITYSKISGPAWATTSPSGLVTVNTNTATKGAHSFTWQAHDGISGGDQETHTINITNNAPTINNVGNKRFLKDIGSKPVQLEVTDADTTDTHTWSKITGPSWGTINPSSGLATFQTNGLSDGVYSFTFRVSDGTDTDDESFDIEIYTAAPAPSFGMIT